MTKRGHKAMLLAGECVVNNMGALQSFPSFVFDHQVKELAVNGEFISQMQDNFACFSETMFSVRC